MILCHNTYKWNVIAALLHNIVSEGLIFFIHKIDFITKRIK